MQRVLQDGVIDAEFEQRFPWSLVVRRATRRSRQGAFGRGRDGPVNGPACQTPVAQNRRRRQTPLAQTLARDGGRADCEPWPGMARWTRHRCKRNIVAAHLAGPPSRCRKAFSAVLYCTVLHCTVLLDSGAGVDVLARCASPFVVPGPCTPLPGGGHAGVLLRARAFQGVPLAARRSFRHGWLMGRPD